MSLDLESARRDWEDGSRRFERTLRDEPGRAESLGAQLDAVSAELRRRVGATFTLAQLVSAYGRADDWARQVLSEQSAAPGWSRSVAQVTDAAFHAYSRGAVDYTP